MKNVLSITAFLVLLCMVSHLAMADSISEPCDTNIVSATIDIDPDTINLKSKGNWITCYIWLPEDHNVADISADSILLEGVIEAEWKWFEIEDQVLMVKFSRPDVHDILTPSEAVELTVTGELADGNDFEGTDIVRVIGPTVPPFAIKRAKVWTSRKTERDRIRISGTIDVTAADIFDANSINVSIWSADDSNEPLYSESIVFSADMVKRNMYRYKHRIGRGGPGAITMFNFNMRKHKFALMAKNIGLADLVYPMSLEIEIGAYSDIATWP